MFVVIGVLVVASIIAYSLLSFSRENRFAIRRFRYTVLSDVLVQGAFQEGLSWLTQGLDNPGSIPELQQFLDDPATGWQTLQTISLPVPLDNSRVLAQELDLAVVGTLGFEKVHPFFATETGTVDPLTQGRVVPDPKECHGWVTLNVSLTHDDFYKEFTLQREFKLVNLLPPVVSKFTLFVRDQDPEAAGKGSPRHLNNLYLDAQTLLCRGVMAEQAPAKPLVLVHSGADEDREGLPVGGGGALPSGGMRQFDPADVRSNYLAKGWVFLGTPAAEGFILGLAAGQLYDYLGAKVNVPLYPDAGDVARRYAGERFQCADVAELIASTQPGIPSVYNVAALNNTPPLFPAAIPAGPTPGLGSLRFKLQFFGACSVERDVEFGVPGLENLRNVFSNYFAAPAANLGYSGSDYRSQHASLLHLMGEEGLEGGRYRDSRSPTLVLGPVKRRIFALGSVHQESDYERGTQPAPGGTPPNTHPANAVASKTAYLPWFDIDAAGQNRSTGLAFTDSWNQVVENEPNAGAPPLLPGLFAKRDYYVTEIFSAAGAHQTYYKNFAMSRFFEEPYLLSADLITHNNVTEPPQSGIYARRTFAEAANRNALLTLAPSAGAAGDESFLYDVSGGLFSGRGLELRGARLQTPGDPASAWQADPSRRLYEGNLKCLSLFGDGFTFGAGVTQPAVAALDLRRKATHWFPSLDEFQRVMIAPGPAGQLALGLDGEIVYVSGTAEAHLGEAGKELVVKGSGMLLFEGPVSLDSSIRMADSTGAAPAARAPLDLPPFTVVSVTGAITLRARDFQASLVALDPVRGTLRREAAIDRVRIAGSVAIDHLELGTGLLEETTPVGGHLGANTFTVSQDNLLVRRAGDWEKLRIVYNDRLEPTLWDNYRRAYRFSMGQSVMER